MQEEMLLMSRNELERSGVIRMVMEKRLTQFGRAVKTLWVTVCEDFIGNAAILYKGRRLEYSTFKLGENPPAIADEKTINQHVDQAIRTQQNRMPWKPAPDHPWKRYLNRQEAIST